MWYILYVNENNKIHRLEINMLKYIDSKKMGGSNLGWLQSHFHFSFSNYYNPDNIDFGNLRVINDDIIAPNTGFDTHPHRDMEILTYVLDGELTHQDSMGHKRVVTRGGIQYMSAGTGITHSEHNFGVEPLRLLQIWIYPDRPGHTPHYGDHTFSPNERAGKLLHLVSDKTGGGSAKINQDANIYVTELEPGQTIDFEVGDNRQAYVVQIEGSAKYNELVLTERDALESVGESFTIEPVTKSHVMILEMKQGY